MTRNGGLGLLLASSVFTVLVACGASAPESVADVADEVSCHARHGGCSDAGGSTTDGATVDARSGDAGMIDSATIDAASEAASGTAQPGPSLVAIDTPQRTYLAYVNVPSSGVWTPMANGWPLMAQWENQTTYSALRFQSFVPGTVLTPAQIMALLPRTQRAAKTIDITAAPYGAQPAPADATSAISAALQAAASEATPSAPVDVLVPAGTFNYSTVLNVGADVRLRRFPEDSGGVLHATDPTNGAVRLRGDRSGALFLSITSGATSRGSTPQSCGVWVGAAVPGSLVHDTLVVGTEVAQPMGAHVFAIGEDGGIWAFNYTHDGYADDYHHTGGSRYCQVVGNRAQGTSGRGDDMYPFVSYAADGDLVHHSACIANWGRDGWARGLAVVGGAFIDFESNDIANTQWAGIYVAQESSYSTYGAFDITVVQNTIAYANLNGSHDGLLAYSADPTSSRPSTTFGSVSNRIQSLTVENNSIADTSSGIGNGFGIEIRSSCDTGTVIGNVLTHNISPQLVVDGSNFAVSSNVINP
jgi:hypothetical protein